MSMSIIITVVACVSVLALIPSAWVMRKLIGAFLAPLQARNAEQNQIRATGIQCGARVLQVRRTGTSISQGGSEAHELELSLEMYPSNMPRYHAQTTAMVELIAFARVQPGCLVTMRYDPHAPARVAIEAAYPPGQGPGAAPLHHGYGHGYAAPNPYPVSWTGAG